ncbi:MAG: copper-binding protein [Xanthobacteraceae bacterium]|nr:copper-binding protein [Xanthobacteraceae bacterium]
MRAAAVAFAIVTNLSLAFVGPADAQMFATPSTWLERVDREHYKMVPRNGHVHATGHVEEVDSGSGTITLWTGEIQSPDRSIWMPPMRMTFHVTNRRVLRGLQFGDSVAFEAARLRNAVMITNLRKLP